MLHTFLSISQLHMGETQAPALGWDSATLIGPPTDPHSRDDCIQSSYIHPPITQQTEQHISETPDLGSHNCVHLLHSSLLVLKIFPVCIAQLLHLPVYHHFTVYMNIHYITVQFPYCLALFKIKFYKADDME